MDLMEYQGKSLFRALDVPTTPEGFVATTVEEVKKLAESFAGPVMVKAQVLTGGRGKAGGVKFCPTPEAAVEAAENILGMDIKGHTVHKVLVEQASDIAEEYYMSILTDRVGKGYMVIASAEGGMDIETVNKETPEKVAKVLIDPNTPLTLKQAKEIVAQGQYPSDIQAKAAQVLVQLDKAFRSLDATLLEINPLIKTEDGRVIALDSKVSIDGNAMFRHPSFPSMASAAPNSVLNADIETKATADGLNYVKLDGHIGVIGNGAGLVMSTLDVVAQAGGKAANFLDIGGGASADMMAKCLGVVLGDPDVDVVLVNVFGGITQCDLVAKGCLEALDKLGDIDEKIVIRLDGTNAVEGRKILEDANHPNIIAAAGMLEAAEKAVKLSDKTKATNA